MIKFYVSETSGNDVYGIGSEDAPYKTMTKALKSIKLDGPASVEIYTDGADERWSKLSKTKIRKIVKTKTFYNLKKQLKPPTSMSLDGSELPTPIRAKIRDIKALLGKRVKIYGWAQNILRQRHQLMVINLRDGTGYLRCLLSKKLCLTPEAVALTPESSLSVIGTLQLVPSHQTVPGGVELHADHWELIGKAPSGGIESVITEESKVDFQLDNRHLVIRSPKTSNILKLVSITAEAFREHYKDNGYFEVLPPTIIKVQTESDCGLFRMNYFGDSTFLAQSSHLYLETCISSINDCFCMRRSYRAEKCDTFRHLTEFTHVEAECPFIDFNILLDRIEELIVDVAKRIIDMAGDLLLEVNPDFSLPKRPFRRLSYKEAVELLRDLNIKHNTDRAYNFGDEISEEHEGLLIKELGEPILLTHFPSSLSTFYMQQDAQNPETTETVDLLLPGVGGIVGGSMRVMTIEDLLDAFQRDNINPESYYWYKHQRQFGTCSHGGYGLGFERFCTWILGQTHIREVCLYPRYKGRCQP